MTKKLAEILNNMDTDGIFQMNSYTGMTISRVEENEWGKQRRNDNVRQL